MNEQIERIMCIVDHLSDTSYCEAKGLKGNVTALELKANIRAAIQALAPVPADCDVRKIMLRVVPGWDGMGEEVYAKSVTAVEELLGKMGEELEEWQLGIRRLTPVSAVPDAPKRFTSGTLTYCGQPARFLGTIKTRDKYKHVLAWETKSGYEHVTAVTEFDRDVESTPESQQAAQPECKTCKGEGGWERAHSSTSYSWAVCPDCTQEAPQPAQQAAHPDDEAVDRFAAAMKQKLALARTKGRGGWEGCSQTDLSRMLREHVEKGDPRDVANFCMFLWSLGLGIVQQEPTGEAVAWIDERAIQWITDRAGKTSAHITTKLSAVKSMERPMPLYTRPQQPLTNEQLKQVIEDAPMPSNSYDVGRWVISVAREVERAHKIGGAA